MAQAGAHDSLGGIRCGFIREMPVPAQNALFEAPGPVRTILQHLDIVIRFEDQHVGGANPVQHLPRRMPEVGQKSKIAGPRAHQETDRVLGVVRHVECFNGNVPNVETVARAKPPAIKPQAELIFEGFLRRAIAINRDLQFGAELDQSLDVISVFVRDEDAGQVFGRAANGGEPLADLPQAEPRINKDARLIRFQIRAIAGGTAAENS